ncbi:hypothetical protein DYB30_010732 [Aphanomyces astaci]|uniref:DDE-1 domain-containing protein n=1 Tax=Aphanomyces astaci TaxID=112090 RepID=A0A397CRL9_APHAT|nr:hypothetical protein DYB30_010732 [Aphanomyces astaci]
MKGVPGARIETKEFPTFPRDYHYAIQENAWMDALVWRQYLRNVLGESIEEPSVVLMNNFECYVSDESYNPCMKNLAPTFGRYRRTQPRYANHLTSE